MDLQIDDEGLTAVETVPKDFPTSFDVDQLPASFKSFLEQNEIDPGIYKVNDLPRYVRVNTQLPVQQRPTLQDLRSQLKTDKVFPVEGLEDFYSIQLNGTDQRISDIPAYKQRSIFGIDVSSAIAVKALEIGKDDQVLDICCAPGAKLCMIANIIGKDGLGTVTGVDIAPHRLSTCRSLIKKYKVGERLRLFEADGTTFAVRPPSKLGNKVIDYCSSDESCDLSKNKANDDSSPKAKRQKIEYLKPFYASKMLRFDDQQIKTRNQLYTKVLVDAECTHDGSILHILKYEKWGWDKFEKNFMDPERLANIVTLQRNLMKQGWGLVKEGGLMVYSTCSLSVAQNEENVSWFLENFKDAKLENIPNFNIKTAKVKVQHLDERFQEDINTHCLRFDPIHSHTSGFFVARFKKLK